jgi:hypothetical protein
LFRNHHNTGMTAPAAEELAVQAGKIADVESVDGPTVFRGKGELALVRSCQTTRL